MKTHLHFKHAILIFLLLLSFSCQQKSPQKDPFVAEDLSVGKPENAQVSSERLSRIDKVLQEAVDSNWVKNVTAFIARHGKIVYNQSFGYVDEENNKPLSNDAIFRIASQTKAITSVAVMMLFEEGKFLLDDPISRYIPAFAHPEVVDTYNEEDTTYTTIPADREITIRDLLTHTSGLDYLAIGSPRMRAIYYKNGFPAFFGSDNVKLGDLINHLAEMPLAHQPGEKFTYGMSVDVLGYLVEVISGMPLNEFFRTRIFEPLGMNDTYFYLPDDKKDRLVPVFTLDSKDQLIYLTGPDEYNIWNNYPLLNGTFFSGGAGLSSTTKDYGTFLQMMLNKGVYHGKRLLARRTVELMTTNQLGDVPFGKNGFGLGFEVFSKEGELVLGQTEGSFAWGGYWGTTYWADPKEGLVALIFMNQRPLKKGDLQDKFKAMVYQALDD